MSGDPIPSDLLRQENAALRRRIAMLALELEAQRRKTSVFGAGDGVVFADAQGRLLGMKLAAERLTGWTEAQAQGRLVSEVVRVIDEDTGEEIEDLVAQTVRQGVLVVAPRTLLVARDGSTRPIAIGGVQSLHEGADRPGVVLEFRDLTGSAEAQVSLPEGEPSPLVPEPESSDGYYRCGLDGVMFEHNASFNRTFGITAGEDLRGTRMPDVWLRPDDRVKYLTELRARGAVSNYLFNGKTRAGEKLILRLSSRLTRDAQGTPIGIEGVFADFTLREPAQTALRRSDERLRDAQRIALLGNWELDLTTNAFSWSDEIFRIFELDPALVVPSWEALLAATHPEDRDAFEAAQVQSLQTHRPTELTHRLLLPDGRLKQVQTRCDTACAPDGTPLRSLGTMQDVTERALLEEQLRQAQKMEAIGSLAGGVAHDFNNLLAVILNATEFALEAAREGDPLREDLLEVKGAAERAVGITRQLLAMGRRQVLKPAPVILNGIVVGLERMLRRILGAGIELSLVLAPDLGVVVADSGQLEQVLMNLVVNARDAMTTGGTLTIKTTHVEVDEAQASRLGALPPGSCVALSVTDTGSGMDLRTQAHMFEPFFSTKPEGKGTGLGLATVYGIIKQSGGGIVVDSRLGRGTTFTVFLPRARVAAVEPAVSPAEGQRRGVGTETILVAEDEEALRRATRRTLEAAGYRVLTAGNGEEAVQTHRRHEGPIHLLLTDVVMPLMGGKLLAERLTSLDPALQVIYMSGYVDEASIDPVALEAAGRFLSKPFTTADLNRRVRAVLDEVAARSAP